MKTFFVIAVTAVITWVTASVVDGVRTDTERVWMLSAVKAPGRMALSDIQADMNAGHYTLAKAKLDVLMATWQRFDVGPTSFKGTGIGDIMMTFSKLDANNPAPHN